MALEIQEWLWDNIGWKIRDIYRSIKSIIKWFPVIWKDRDWDDYYIFEILKTKLKHQAKYIGDRDIHTRAKYDAQKMMLCVRLIDKIQDEYYNIEYIDYCESEFDFIDSDKPGFKEMIVNEISENFDEYFNKYPLIYKKAIDGKGLFPIIDNDTGEISKKRIAMNIAYMNQNRCRKLLFKILEEHIEGWWD